MSASSTASPWRSPRLWLGVIGPIVLITLFHYGTAASHHWLHDIFRRLYYLPIILGAFFFGLRGALAASVLASVLYLPHAAGWVAHMAHDPGRPVEKVLEVLLYNVIAVITGVLADRERAERQRQARTAERLAESLRDLQDMEQQLIRAGRLQALGELTAGLAHEIKNPLASLKGTAEILGDEIAQESPRRRMWEIHHSEIDRLGALLERFLSFARPAALSTSAVSVLELVQRTRDLVQAQAGKQGVSLALSPSAEALEVRGDPEQLVQVLLNLTLNAVQVSPSGGTVQVSTSVGSRGRRRYVCVLVKDEGPGVPDALREKIFNPFFTSREGGTGLGLAIASRIADAHEGFIEVGEAPGGGASFELWVPASEDCAVEVQSA